MSSQSDFCNRNGVEDETGPPAHSTLALRPPREQLDHPNMAREHSKYKISLISNIFFLLGSVLYLVMSVDDLQWAHALTSRMDVSGDVYYADFYWYQLPEEQRACAEALGYDQLLWDTGGTAPEGDAWWADLRDDLRQAAECLGYDADLWDNQGDTDAASTVVGENQDEYGQVETLEDDYVFNVPVGSNRQARVSRYMILYFSAALCFVIVGILEFFRGNCDNKSLFYPSMLVLAGMFGMVSAMLVERNIEISNIYSLISVHFFFIEAVAIAQYHITGAAIHSMGFPKWSLFFADLCFGTGALIDVVLSYFYVFDTLADSNTRIAATNVAAQTFWLVCSLIYLASTLLGYWTSMSRSSENSTNSKDFRKREADDSSTTGTPDL